MSLRFSNFGKKFTQATGASQLMLDLGVATQNPGTLMLGGGNPAIIPEVESAFRTELRRIAGDQTEFARFAGRYSGPEGERRFREAVAAQLSVDLDAEIKPENVALTAGSQNAFFMLFNLFSGPTPAGEVGKILLP